MDTTDLRQRLTRSIEDSRLGRTILLTPIGRVWNRATREERAEIEVILRALSETYGEDLFGSLLVPSGLVDSGLMDLLLDLPGFKPPDPGTFQEPAEHRAPPPPDLELRISYPSYADEDAIREALGDLAVALNKIHRSQGGSGLEVRDAKSTSEAGVAVEA